MKGLVILFKKAQNQHELDSESFHNPGIDSVSTTIEGLSNKVYTQDIKPRHFFEEASRYFMDPEKKDSCLMDLEKYSEGKFGLFLDLRSFSDNAFHGSGIKVMNTKDGIQLQIKKKTGTTACRAYIFLLTDSMLSIQNSRLKSVAY